MSASIDCASYIEALSERGIVLVTDGDRLTIRATQAPVDAGTIETLRSFKAEMIAHLTARQAAPESAGVGSRVPAGSTQQRLWWLSGSIEQPTDAYSVVSAYRIRGSLDLQAWRDAVGAVMARHHAFVTSFEERDGCLYLFLDGSTAPPIELEPTSEAGLPALLGHYARRVASPRMGELLCHGLHAIGPDDNVYVLACHHVVLDGRSLEIFFDEVRLAYLESSRGLPSSLGPAPLQFIDLMYRDSRYGGGSTEASVDYWVDQLQGAGRRLQWPVREHGEHADGLMEAALPQDVTCAIHEYSRTHSVGLFSLLYAAFKILLHRLGGGTEFLVGHPVANRPTEAALDTIGCFANTVMLRARVEPQLSFAAFVDRVEAESLSALDHQNAPLDQVATRLQQHADDDRSPFQALFSLQRSHPLAIEGLLFERINRVPSVAKFPLSLMIDETASTLRASWEYAGRVLSLSGVADLHERFVALLRSAMGAPQTSIARLDIFSRRDRALAGALPTELATDAIHDDLIGRFRAVAASTPDGVALIFQGRHCTYAELDSRTDEGAAQLVEAGIQDAQLVGVQMAPGLERIIALLSILKAGAAYVPLPSGAAESRLLELCHRFGVTICLADHQANWSGVDTVVLSAATAASAECTDAVKRSPRTMNSVAYVNFSSGTTGVPKAIACTDAGVTRLVLGQSYATFGEQTRMLCAAPIDFDAFTLELWAPLLNGGTCVLMPDGIVTPAALREAVDVAGVNTVWLTSALFNTLVDIDPRLFDGITQVLTGGDVVSPDHVARVYEHDAARDIRIINGYGPTENTTFTACFPIPRDWPRNRPLPIGRALGGTGVHILDDQGEAVPHRVVGEIVATGLGLAVGYLGQDELTSRAFPTCWIDGALRRCYRTGDQGYFDEDGILHFVGRRDGQVKINGHRIELAAIDSVLRAYGAVLDSASIAVKRDGVQKLVSLIVIDDPQAGNDTDRRAALERHLTEHLPAYHVPQELIFIDRMPLTPNGKLDRAGLQSIYDVSGRTTVSCAMSATETRVADIWSELLGRKVGTPDLDFFAAGGSSLLAMRMLARVNAALGSNAQFHDLLSGSTLQQFSRRLRPAGGSRQSEGAPMLRAPLTPRQQLLWNLHRLDRSTTTYNVQCVFRLTGPLDRERLDSAMRRIYSSHASLHARIGEEDGVPMQEAAPDPMWSIEWLDAADAEASPEDWVQRGAQRPFDIAKDAGLVARVMRLGPEQHLLQWLLPHVVIDGWSLDVVWDRLCTLYAQPEAVLPFSDFSAYAAAASEGDRDAAYWKDRLSGWAPISLESRRSGPADAAAGILQQRLDQQHAQALRDLAASCGVSAAAVALAAYARVLGALLDTSRVVVSVPCANRHHSGSQDWVGYFASMLPLPLEMDADLNVASWLRAVNDEIRSGMAHPDVDQDRLLRELELQEGRVGNPLQRAVFAWQDAPSTMRALDRVHAVRCASVPGPAKFPLMLTVADDEGRLSLRWEYASALFDASEVAALDQAFRNCLLALAAMPENPLSQTQIELSARQPAHRADELSTVAAEASYERAESAVAASWRAVLGNVPLDAQSNLFKLGGNSLSCLRVQAELRRTHGYDVDLHDLLSLPVLGDIAWWLVTEGRATAQKHEPDEVEAGPVAMSSLPLSREQQRLWFIHQLQPSSAYNVPLLFELHEGLDVARLYTAVKTLRDRHVALRLRVQDNDGEAEQREDDQRLWEMHLENICSGELPERLLNESRHIFDLTGSQTFRVSLLCVDDVRHLLLLNIHHMFIDGRSVQILMQELTSLYRGQRLPQKQMDFDGVVRWQQGQEYELMRQRALDHWQRRLKGAPEQTALEADRHDPLLLGKAAQRRLGVDAAFLSTLRACTRENGVSEFSGWMALFACALSRCTQMQDLVLAVPAANRNGPQFHDVIGFLANTLPVRLNIQEELPFCKLMRTVFAVIVEDVRHSACPLEELVVPRADYALPPLSHVIFSMVGQEATPASYEQPLLRALPIGNTAAKYPLAVTVRTNDDDAEWIIEYDAGRYSPHVISGLEAAIGALQEHVVLRSHLPLCSARVASLDMNTVSEQERACYIPLIAQISGHVKRSPQSTALYGSDGTQVSYGVLWSRANACASRLRMAGITPRDRVGILMHRTDKLPVALLAVMMTGAAYVPLDPNYPVGRMEAILQDSEPALLLVDSAETALGLGSGRPTLVLVLEEHADLSGDVDSAMHLHAPDELAYIIYTSGSTGAPKGVAIRHESLYWLHRWAAATYDAGDLRNVMAATSVCFDLSVFEIFITLSLGGGLSLVENALSLIDDARAQDVSLINSVPSLIEEVLRHTALPASTRVVNLAGEALHPSLVGRVRVSAPSARIYNLYGPSEDTTYSTAKLIDGEEVTLGRPIDGTGVHVLDEQRRPLPDGMPGELYLSGMGLAAGYFGNSALTSERFVDLAGSRLYQTGDRVRRLANGDLEYLGRLDNQCKLRGYRIELGEIERTLSEHASVRDVAVIGVDLVAPEARLVAFITLAHTCDDPALQGDAGGTERATAEGDGGASLVGELRRFLGTRLPNYMLPERIIVVGQMPLTPSGKLDRRALGYAVPPISTPAAALSAEEAWCTAQFADALGVPGFGVDDSLIMSGASPAQIGELLARLGPGSGGRITYAELLHGATPRRIASYLKGADERSEEDSSSLLI